MTIPDRPPEDSANDANRAERGSSPSVGFTDSMRQMAVEARSSSPAKRSASEFEEQEGERENGVLVRPTDSPVSARKKSVLQIASPMPSRFKPVPESAAEQDDKMLLDEEENVSALVSNDGSDNKSSRSNGVNRHSSPPTSNSAQSIDQELVVSVEHTDSKKLPSYDEQINTVRETVQNAVDEEGSRGYLISTRWISRVEARTTSGIHASYGKELRKGEVGPVDNSDIAHNDHLYGDLRMASGEPFVPLREGLSPSTDFEIIPQQAWDMIVAWYGVAEDSHIMVRYMHSTSPEPGAIGANMQYELYPPICTIQTLRNDRSGSSLGGLKRQDSLAPNIVVSRSDTLRTFFQQLKTVAEIDLQTRIRVWRLLETGSTSLQNSKMPTPASSRAASPITSDQLPQTRPNLVVDPASFLALEEGTHRERLDLSDDAVYDTSGSQATLNTVGLPSYCTLILDEQLSGAQKEEYVSDSVRLSANTDTKKGLDGTQNLLKPHARHGDGRRSPTPTGIMTRGRTNKKGRTRGATGLTNLGNSCYMNSALQCVRSIEELSIYFLAQKHLTEINENNPLGHKGQMVKAYGGFISSIYSPDSSGSFPPRNFKNTLGKCQPLFSGYGQQDSQEFLSFLVDGLHEDLNRVHKKPYMENPESDDKTVHDPQAVRELGEKFRANHKARNDSVAMDLFNGFYKNTMICPNCDKVSVTFDPYSLLTLQLPIASTFQHQFGFMPLRGRPRYLDVDIDKNSTFRTLKEWIGKRVKVSSDRLVVVEEYNQKLYLVFEDASVLSESNLQPADLLWVYELDESPTNWPPAGTRKNRSYGMLNSGNDDIPDMTSPLADRMAVPLLHRGTTKYGSKFDLPPSCVLITRDEAKDADKILRKVLQKVQTLTTRPLFDEAGMQRGTRSQEASDSEVMHDDDGLSTDDSRVQARSIEGEDGLVDVSVGPPTDKSSATSTSNGDVSVKTEPDILDPATYIFPELRHLFDIKIAPPSGRIIPAGMSFGDGTRCQTLSHRVQNQPSGVSRRRVSNASRRSALESESSEDELARDDGHAAFGAATPPESDDDMTQTESPTIKKVGQLGSVARNPGATPVSDSQMEYLVQLGEALVLDWSEQGYDLLFGDNRGTRTDQNLELIPDPELDEKKARRASRKKNGVSLEECFEETAKSEVLSEDNAWYCGRCKELRRATKKLEIWTVPDILVIHLKRFSSQSRLRDKIDVLVDFPTEGLDLEHKVGLPDGKSLTYDLFAVDNHYGGLGGGHYTAYAQNFFDKQWYEYNDQMVSATKPEGVVTRAAYLLFYRCRSDRPLGGKYLEEVVNDAYAATDSNTLSGEDSRPGDSISNGSSEDSQEAGTATGAGANHQGAQRIGSLNGYRHDLADIAKNAQDSGEDGDTLEPPPYNDDRFDEGFFDQGQDDPMPSLEADQQGFVGPLGLQPEATWNFDSLQQQGPTASPASSNMNMDDDRSGELNGESQHTRIAQDFGDDGELDNQFDDSDRFGGHGVEHISAYNNDEDAQDGPVTEIKLGSDDEGSSRGRH